MTFDWAFTWQILPDLLRASRITVQATIGGMALALCLGLIWALLRRAAFRPVSFLAALIVEFVRSTPLLVQLYFFFFVFPRFGMTLEPFLTGVLALGLHYSAYTAEVYRAGIEGVPRGQWEAARALNLSPGQTLRHIVLPQAIPPMVPALGNYLIAMFKDTPLLSAITVYELLQSAKVIGAEYFKYLEPLTVVGALFLLVSLIAARGVRFVEQRLIIRES